MGSTTNKSREVPMSVRMARALESIKRMSPSEQVKLLVRAGLVPESEIPKAVRRLTETRGNRRKSKAHRSGSQKKAAKQSDD